MTFKARKGIEVGAGKFLVNEQGDVTARVVNQIVNVKSFGAKGDSVTDDSNAVSLAAEHCIQNGGILFFPRGDYRHPTYTIPDTIACLYETGELIQSNRATFKFGTKQPLTNMKKGHAYFDTTTNALMVYDGTAWVQFARKNGSETINGNLTITGDLLVQGDNVVLNVAQLEVEDNIITLNRGVTGSPTLDSGIEVQRGTAPKAKVIFDETEDVWKLDNGNGVLSRISHGGAVNVKDFGAKGDGVTDDTAAIQRAIVFATANKKRLHFGDGTFNVSKVTIPQDFELTFSNTILKRVGGVGRLLEIADNCVVLGSLKIDGNKSVVTGGKAEGGLSLGSNCKVYCSITSFNNNGHGVVISGATRTSISDVVSYNNGNNPDALGNGTGDGICVTNSTFIHIDRAICFDNARIGITVTSYNATTSALDSTLATDTVVTRSNCYNNAYLDYDFEGVSRLTGSDLFGFGKCSVSSSKFIRLTGLKLRYLYGGGTENVTVEKAEIRPSGTVSNVFYLEGKELSVQAINIYDTATTYTSNTLEVVATDNLLSVSDVFVEKGNNSVKLTGAYSAKNLRVGSALNIPIQIDSRRPPIATQGSVSIINGSMSAMLGKQPGTGFGFDTGTYKVGDTVMNSSPTYGSPTGWICTVAGSPGTWEPIGFVGGQEKQASLPTASASQRGRMVRIEGSVGVADSVYVCVKKADDSYDWAQLF